MPNFGKYFYIARWPILAACVYFGCVISIFEQVASLISQSKNVWASFVGLVFGFSLSGIYSRMSIFDNIDAFKEPTRIAVHDYVTTHKDKMIKTLFIVAFSLMTSYLTFLGFDTLKWPAWIPAIPFSILIYNVAVFPFWIIPLFRKVEDYRYKLNEEKRKIEARNKLIDELRRSTKEKTVNGDGHLAKYNTVAPGSGAPDSMNTEPPEEQK